LEETALRFWASDEQLIIDNSQFQEKWNSTGCLGESEHDVIPDAQLGIWLKRNNLNHHGSYLEYFHRLLLHNWLFPDTKLTLVGFAEYERRPLPVVSQLDIPASRGATQFETDGFMEQMGFTPIRKENPTRQEDYLHRDAGIEVNDLHDEKSSSDTMDLSP
jgi:hypothetical protein